MNVRQAACHGGLSFAMSECDAQCDLVVVVPVFNEEAAIVPFLERIYQLLHAEDIDWRILFVNDGSRDKTMDVIRRAHARNGRVRAIDLSRNFGKEVAICAGLDHANGRAVILMDVDLQDPPELILDMLALWREGYEIVQARRADRSSDSFLKRNTARLFYRLINFLSPLNIPVNVGDFRLLDARVVHALRLYRERERFTKGIFASVGFRTATIDYVRPARQHGETKFSPVALTQLSIQGITSFSALPLKIWTYVGLAIAFAALLYACVIAVLTLVSGVTVPGYASVAVFILFFNGLTLIGMGIQGEYIARIFSEVKARPLYILREELGEQPADETDSIA